MIPALKTHQRHFQAGLEAAKSARGHFRKSWEAMLDAGVYFRQAQETAPDGTFLLMCDQHIATISRRSIYRYIEHAETVLAAAAADRPDLKDDVRALLAHAKTMLVQSPKSMVALLRECGEMRKFGEYDAVRYQIRQADPQIRINWSRTVGWIDRLSNLSTGQIILDLPDGKQPDEALQELETKLTTALESVRAARTSSTITEATDPEALPL